jgi:hypothetical protein
MAGIANEARRIAKLPELTYVVKIGILTMDVAGKAALSSGSADDGP